MQLMFSLFGLNDIYALKIVGNPLANDGDVFYCFAGVNLLKLNINTDYIIRNF